MRETKEADLAGGGLERMGLVDGDALARADEVLAEVHARGIETVRLSFADQHGLMRGKTVLASSLATALREGIRAPSTVLMKDLSQRTAFPVWSGDAGFGEGQLTGAGDILLVPDPASFRVLPWAETTGWIQCDVAATDGGEISFAPRRVLRKALEDLSEAGYRMTVGLEIEFHVYRVEEAGLDADDIGMPGSPPRVSALTNSYGLLGEDRADALDDVAEALRKATLGLGLPLRSIEHEFGPSQLEFVFDAGDPLEQADAFALFRSAAKQVCRRMGLHATFMCQPKVGESAASGWHLHQSLSDKSSGVNLFMPADDTSISREASGWIAGLLEHAPASCLMTTPTVNGYRRFKAFQMAPDRIQWAVDNRGAMIRGMMRPGDKASRIENRTPEPAASPHLAIASQVAAGLDGLKRGLVAPKPVENPYAGSVARLPGTLGDALSAFEASDLYKQAFGEAFHGYYSTLKRAEWNRYLGTLSDWEQSEYFSVL